MSTNKPPKSEPEVHVHDVSKLRGHLKVVGGSMSDDWNNLVANQTTRTLWFFADSDPEEIRRERHAAVDALMGIKPGDELEGMIAAQLIACHNASMECYRRAMIRDQTFEGRREALIAFGLRVQNQELTPEFARSRWHFFFFHFESRSSGIAQPSNGGWRRHQLMQQRQALWL